MKRKIKEISENKKARNATMITLTERWDVDMLNTILGRRDLFIDKQGEFTVLESISNNINFGELRVSYNYSNKSINRKWGRVYGKGLQSVNGWIRRLCSHQYYHDIDIVNCFPVILFQICQHCTVTCDTLALYVEDRETIIQNDMDLYNLSREAVKQSYLKCLFGGGANYDGDFLLT